MSEDEEVQFNQLDPDTPYGTEEFLKTTKGQEFFGKLKTYRKDAEKADRESQKLENEATRLITEAAAALYPETVKVEAAKEDAWQARTRYEHLLGGQKQIENAIQRVLMNWPNIRKAPAMYYASLERLEECQASLKKALAKEDYALCQELKEHIEDMKLSVETWERIWTSATGDPIPQKPRDASINPATVEKKSRIRSVLKIS